MKILVTGISGSIARCVARYLRTRGHTVIGVSTTVNRTGTQLPDKSAGLEATGTKIIGWDSLNASFLESYKVDAIINLAGAPMLQRWSTANREKILHSRLDSYRNIYRAVIQLPRDKRPRCIVNASSVAIYSSKTIPVDEDSSAAPDSAFFQSQVWHQVEQQTRQCQLAGVRSVIPRFGVALGPDQRLAGMLRAARLYLGATLGSGKQQISWISHIDLSRAIEHLLFTALSGPVNIVAPQCMTAAEFGWLLAQSVNRPARLRIPETALRLLLGELAENFLCSAEVMPTRLTQSGFQWQHANAAMALGAIAQELGFHNFTAQPLRQQSNNFQQSGKRRAPWNWT